MLDLGTLNPEQRDAVTQISGPVMILAGAGTGKTKVITCRIAYLLGAGVPADSIVALSFTNKAAREMAARARAIAGERIKNSWLGTFHSFCLAALRRFPEEAGLQRGFALAGTSDQLDLVRRALDERGWSGAYDASIMHAQISRAKNALLGPEDLRKVTKAPSWCDDPAALSEVYDLYERQLRLNRVIDFDDCIFRTVRLLRSSDTVRGALRRQYRYLMVDEFQDTNEAQLSVMSFLASDGHDVCVVGDDDQSIYSWRGAMYEILERFEQLFPKTRVIKLEQNYRCTNVILGAANGVIKNNARRKDKTLWSASDDKTPIELAALEDETAEANHVAEKCLALLGRGHSPADIAVLYRANAQARPIELALREARISYKTFGGQSFFERREVKDFLCYLRLALDREDRLALWRVINVPQRGIGLKSLERIDAEALARKRSPFAILDEGLVEIGKAQKPARTFVDMIKALSKLPLQTEGDAEAFAQAVLKSSGLEQDVRVNTEDAGSRERKIANLKSLPAWIGTLARDLIEEDGALNPNELLDTLTLDGDRREEKEGPRNYVSLMTIHAAKGLEFPAVFAVGLEEDQLPHRASATDPQALCEERRLFYVALTRAKTNLYLSHCIERNGGYQGRLSRTPSRFLKELPAGLGSVAAPPDAATKAKIQEERKANTLSRLGAIRASLVQKP